MELVPVVNGIKKVIGSSRCGTRTSLHGTGDDSVFTDAWEPDGNESFASVERLLREIEPLPPNFNIERLWLRVPVTMAALLAVGCYPRLDGELHKTRLASAPAEFPSAEQRREPRLVDIHGQEQRPFEESEARAIVLVFMIHDCPIANSYIPALNRLYDSFAPRGIRFLLVQADPRITLERALEHAQQYEIKVPVVLDSEHFWVNRTGATKSPQAVVLSRDGNILYCGRMDDQYVGLGKRRTQTTSHDLSDAIEAILASRTIPRTNTEPIGCDIPSLPYGE